MNDREPARHTSDFPRRSGPDDLRLEAQSALGEVLDRVAAVVIVGGVLLVSVAGYRAFTYGKDWLVVAYVMILAAITVTFMLRRRVSLATVSGMLIAAGLAWGVIAILTFGLAGGGIVVFSVTSIATALLLGVRAGLATFFVGLFAVVLAAALALTGHLPMVQEASKIVASPYTWLTQIAVFSLLTLHAIVLQRGAERKLLGLVDRLRQRSEALRESEEKYRLLAEGMSDVLFRQDMNRAITYVSPSVERVLGYTPDEVMRLGTEGILTRESFAKATASYRATMAAAELGDVQLPFMEYEYVRRDGSTLWGEMHVAVLRDAAGKVTGVQGVVRDTTARRRADDERTRLQEQLRQAAKMEAIGYLAGGVAHDLKNQLTGIAGNAEVLKFRGGDDPVILESADMILQCSRRCTDLTGKLLAFARKSTYQPVETDVHDLVREVVSILERSIDKSIRITVDLAAPSSVVIGDPTQLQSALLNIAINARDAMPDGGSITFATAVVGGNKTPLARRGHDASADAFVEIVVRDTGSGMDGRTRERLFEPFFTTKPPGKGTGMGLAAVHATVVAHNGAVLVDSAVGRGTTFSIYLPVAPAAASADVPSSRGRIMVVEDEPVVRQLLAARLRTLGYDVLTCADGAQAVEAYQQSKEGTDLVILDMVLPRLEGERVFAAVRAVNPAAKVVLMSEHSDDREAAELIRQGALGVVTKPFALSELAARVTAALALA
jgi:two-component system, cell cycle sensor histidine kinase and response regulator CckA